MLDKKQNNAMSLIMLGICKRIQNKFNTQLTINTIIKKPRNSETFLWKSILYLLNNFSIGENRILKANYKELRLLKETALQDSL